jgi:hypothetical protein
MATDPPPDSSGPIDEADGRHLTPEQRDDIAASLQDSEKGQVSMAAAASDKEAVSYEAEIAEVLEDSGFEVEIDNARPTPPGEEASPGVEATIADETVRPRHAFRVVQAFRRVGVAVATKINSKRRRKNTLFIAVGPNDTPPTPKNPLWQSKSMTAVIAKWKTKFAAGLHWPGSRP